MIQTGRPWDELEDTLTVPRLQALEAEWRRAPPVRELFAAFVGYEAPLTAAEQWQRGAMEPADFARWVTETGGRKLGPGG